MNFITIDFSLNSPGICVFNSNTEKYHFISYLKRTGTKKAIKTQEDLALMEGVTLVFQPDWETHVDYSSIELAKIKRYDIMSNDIIELITKHVDKEDSFKIAFEGVSYGSSAGTNNIIDMASAASILKIKLLKYFKPEDILTIAPSTIKKHAGKGNMNKLQLFEAYQQNVNDDPILARSPLHSMVKDLEIGKKIPKPLDDLVDAYFLVTYVSNPST